MKTAGVLSYVHRLVVKSGGSLLLRMGVEWGGMSCVVHKEKLYFRKKA